MSRSSSRSFLIVTINLEFSSTSLAGTTKSTLHLVDFAGCERMKKTGACGDSLREASNIAKSISAFGNVMYALHSPTKIFIPYRDSKLTMILRDSVNSDNCVFCLCVNPSAACYDETLCALRFAERIFKSQRRSSSSQQDSPAQTLISSP